MVCFLATQAQRSQFFYFLFLRLRLHLTRLHMTSYCAGVAREKQALGERLSVLLRARTRS